jgi:hypothetical protein
MSKNNKGMICLLNPWEWEDRRVNRVVPDCRNHKHLSRRRVFEHSGKVRFADRILAEVYDAQRHLVGFIVEVAGRVRWCEELGDQECRIWLDAASTETINTHLNRFQAVIDAGQRLFEVITLPKRRGNKPGIPPRDAIVNETLRSNSRCSLTSKDSELNAEGALRKLRTERDHER